MQAEKNLSYSDWFLRKEAVVIALVQWVPLSIGKALRKLTYRSILGRIGSATVIHRGVEFIGAERIEIGNRVTLDRDVRLRNLGSRSKIWIGDKVFCDRGVDIKTHQSGKIEIGEGTYIGPYTCLSGDSIKIGKYCLIASHSGIYANNHIFADPTRYIQEQGASYQGIVIEDDCWLGSGVKVVDGVTIGKGSVIGAGAVVTKNIPPYSIAVGVPAKVIGRRDSNTSRSGKPNFSQVDESLQKVLSRNSESNHFS